jgi:hypothetical protein
MKPNKTTKLASSRIPRQVRRVVRRLRWKIESYRRDEIPHIGWRVLQGNGLLIMSELTKEMATRLAGDHNRCLSPNAKLTHSRVSGQPTETKSL